MKWLSESNAFIYVFPDPIHPEDMTIQVDCEVNSVFYIWGKIISDYKRHRRFPLQDCLREAGMAYQRMKDGLAK